jgi:hypothetical protein
VRQVLQVLGETCCRTYHFCVWGKRILSHERTSMYTLAIAGIFRLLQPHPLKVTLTRSDNERITEKRCYSGKPRRRHT